MAIGKGARRVSDASPPDVDQRIGWLLRGWRLHLRPVDNARTFARELTTTGIAADASRVSRWETGQATATLNVLQSYEQLLDVPAGTLASVATALRRAAGQPAATTRFTPPRLQAAFDRLYEAGPLGADWLQLAALVSAKPDLVTLPRQVWRDLTARLLAELAMSVGHAYLARAEAANLLTLHPEARDQLARSVGAYVLSDSPVGHEPVTTHVDVDDPGSLDLLAHLLGDADPDDDGSLSVVADRLQHGRLEPELVSTIHARVDALFHRYGGRGPASEVGLGDLGRALPQPGQERLLQLGAQPQRPEPDAHQRSFSWSRRVLDGTGHEDPMLHWLVFEALFGATFTARACASMTLAAAPARAEVAAGTAALLPGATPPVTLRLAELLTYVGTEAERGVIRGLVAQSSGLPRLAALTAVAHLPGGDPLPELASLAHSPDEVLALQALHSAALSGHPVLESLAADPTVGTAKRFLASWWLAQGPALRDV